MADDRRGTSLSALLVKASSVAQGRVWEDRSFQPALELLLRSCHATAALNPHGRRVLDSIVVRHLVNRLLVEAAAAERPRVASGPVGPVLVVTGPPRTGTTLLHNLLALDPSWRALRFWEALRPVPPDPGSGCSEAELVRQAARWLERLYDLVPGFRSIHPATAEGPEECDALLQNEFASQHLDDMFDARDYSSWLATAPLRREYRSYARQLNVLRGSEVGHRPWVLKSPGHLGHLDALLEACPEATVVQCHRDPAQAVPSYASLIRCLRQAYSDEAAPAVAGRQALGRCRTALARAVQVRAQAPDRFLDVAYDELVADPAGTVAGLYERLGRRLPAGGAAAIRGWLVRNPRHAHGAHRYAADDFGLSAAALAPDRAAYLDGARLRR